MVPVLLACLKGILSKRFLGYARNDSRVDAINRRKVRFIIKMKRIFYVLMVVLGCLSCEDDEKFSSGSGMRLDFEVDTLKLDTVFSNTPSSTYTFWVHNRQDSGLRLQTVRLKKGNQTGFRVNVDGIYLDNSNGSQTSNVEIRRKDSLLVFVELTAQTAHQLEPKLVEDDLLFIQENGTEQAVNLRAWAWDAKKLYDPVIEKDSVMESDMPLVIYGNLTVKADVTLTLKHTSLFFHDQSGMEVAGTLKMDDCELRGDRLDCMFDYLPYDRVSGQWNGVHFLASSTANELTASVIRNTMDGVVMDQATQETADDRLLMTHCVVHNCQGDGVRTTGAKIRLDHCQLTNTNGDCLKVIGGEAEVSYCTIAQFYPFDAARGKAIRFVNDQASPLKRFVCDGTIATGYEEDVVEGEQITEAVAFSFRNSLLRMPAETGSQFEDIIWESPTDEIEGTKQFVKIDEEKQDYDFHLSEQSTAKGKGCY